MWRVATHLTCMKAIVLLLLVGLLGWSSARAAEPGGEPPRLPAPEEIIRRVLDNVEREIANEKLFKQKYRYTRSKVREFRNTEGEVRKTESKVRTNDPLAVVTLKPAPKPRPAPPSPKNKITETETNVRGKAFEESDFPLGEELLQRFEFVVAGRELINGRPAFILDFQPAKKRLPERGLKDKFINKTAGRVWVDEADAVLVKADLFLTEPVTVMGGLVGAVRVFTFNFLRQRTPEGLWFTRDSKWYLEGREVFVKRVVNNHEEIFDVQKVK
jgi:hypothetical protein